MVSLRAGALARPAPLVHDFDPLSSRSFSKPAAPSFLQTIEKHHQHVVARTEQQSMAHGKGPQDFFRFLRGATRTRLLAQQSLCARGRSHAALYECGHEPVQAALFGYVRAGALCCCFVHC